MIDTYEFETVDEYVYSFNGTNNSGQNKMASCYELAILLLPRTDSKGIGSLFRGGTVLPRP